MRFTYFKTIVSKIFDDLINDPEDIRNILLTIKEKEITCGITISGIKYDSVRILNIDEAQITWRLLKNNSSLKKNSFISEIQSLEVTINDDLLINIKPKPSRWSTLDAGADV